MQTLKLHTTIITYAQELKELHNYNLRDAILYKLSQHLENFFTDVEIRYDRVVVYIEKETHPANLENTLKDLKAAEKLAEKIVKKCIEQAYFFHLLQKNEVLPVKAAELISNSQI